MGEGIGTRPRIKACKAGVSESSNIRPRVEYLMAKLPWQIGNNVAGVERSGK